MFPSRLFPDRYFAPRFFPKTGEGDGVVPPTFTGLADLIKEDLGIFDTSMLDLSGDLRYFD